MMADRALLRLSAALLVLGEVLFGVAQVPHPGGGPTIESTFAGYAASGDWFAIHLGQFVGMAVLLAGLLVLYFALDVPEGPPRWAGFFGAVAAGLTLALAGVLYAVDGVALKQAVDAWASAPPAEQATRLAAAEAIRWLELGTDSYQLFAWGLAQVLFATAMVWTASVPRPVGYLMGVSGLAWLVRGWLTGTLGFTAANTVPTNVGFFALLAASVWLLVVGWRMQESRHIATAST
jgi:hypothetical protein